MSYYFFVTWLTYFSKKTQLKRFLRNQVKLLTVISAISKNACLLEEKIGQYLSVSHRNDLYLYFSAKDNEVCVQFPLEIGSASVEITVQI